MTAPKTKQLAKPRILQDSPVTGPDGGFLTVHEAIVMAVKGGNTAHDAAWFAGINPTTLSRWITRGTEALARTQEKQADACENPDGPHSKNETPEDNPDGPYMRLVQDMARNNSLFRMRMRGHISEAAKDPKHWQAAVAALQADERGSWCPPSRVEVTGANGGPVASVGTVRLEGPGDVAALEASLRLRAAEARAIEVGEVPAE